LQVATLLDKVATMAKYKIAWMPGDGVGDDVMEAARIVLDGLKLDTESVVENKARQG
jgi:isocitrate/isopropylmalate dehydrogenase